MIKPFVATTAFVMQALAWSYNDYEDRSANGMAYIPRQLSKLQDQDLAIIDESEIIEAANDNTFTDESIHQKRKVYRIMPKRSALKLNAKPAIEVRTRDIYFPSVEADTLSSVRHLGAW